MQASLIRSLTAIYPLSEGLKTALYEQCNYKLLNRNEVLLREGETCQYLYFVHEGLLRAYHYEGDKEVTSWFRLEEDVVMSISGFYEQQPSDVTIEALEDTALLRLHYTDLQRIYAAFPEANTIGRMLMERYVQQSDERARMLCMPARERYLYILERRPELVQRVSLFHLASYLDMTIWTLSKVRRRR